jgi:F-type H+-transporting ATPase subunit delta
MKISREARKLTRELFSLACPQGRPDPERIRQIADAILKDKPRFYTQILKEFTRLVRLELAKHHATVSSAVPLAPATQNQVRGELVKHFGEETTFTFRVDPGLIGGMRVQHGSDVLDGSIRSHLENLRQAI